MNWYIYWYFTIKYFFWGLLGYGRAGNYIGGLFFYFPFIALIMLLIAPFHFINENKIVVYICVSLLFMFIKKLYFGKTQKDTEGGTITTGITATTRKVGFLLLFL